MANHDFSRLDRRGPHDRKGNGVGIGGHRPRWILNLQSGKALRVASAPIGIPAWPPDGSKLAFDLRINFPSIAEVWLIETKVLEGLKPEALSREPSHLP